MVFGPAHIANEDVETRSIEMNLLNLLLLALAYLIGAVIVKRALERTKNDSDTNDGRNPRGVRTKLMIGRLRGT
jgi:hypothetical protein